MFSSFEINLRVSERIQATALLDASCISSKISRQLQQTKEVTFENLSNVSAAFNVSEISLEYSSSPVNEGIALLARGTLGQGSWLVLSFGRDGIPNAERRTEGQEVDFLLCNHRQS